MSSVRETITQKAVAAVSAPAKPAGLNVHRSRQIPIEEDALPAVVVFVHQEGIERVGGKHGPVNKRTLVLGFHCRAAGDPVDQTLDPLLVWVEKALMSDPELAALVNNVQPASIEWSGVAKDKSLGAALLLVAIEYQALSTDSTEID